MSYKDPEGPWALYHINPDFRVVYLTYFMFEGVFFKNTSTSKILSDHFSRFLHKLYLLVIIYARYLSEVHQGKPTQT